MRLRVMSWARFGIVLLFPMLLALAAGAQELACPAVNPPSGQNFQGQTIVRGNFSYRDLTNADFSGATLIAPYFAYANLTNANFQGAIIMGDDTNPAMSSDFSFANVGSACFIGTRFQGLAYFTDATLTCADFSKVDLTGQNVIFGEKLTFDQVSNCRPKFRFAVMDCEFFNYWRYMDLEGADIKACASEFAGEDFSGAKLNSVNLAGANLTGTKFVRANLNRATLSGATLIGADLSYASLLGANLNFANLTNASLYHAFLSSDPAAGIINAASLQHAHLKNANLSFAQLTGANFSFANVYGGTPAGTGKCPTAPSISDCGRSDDNKDEGFACGCASAHGAIMALTKFSGAYLYGVDFTDALIQSVDFDSAVLTGANFKGASISTYQGGGRATNFSRAFLQGTSLDAKEFPDEPNLFDAFVDFRPRGNTIFILLDGKNHNVFACDNCSPPAKEDVCVDVTYYGPTLTPGAGVSMDTCPNGDMGRCGPAEGSNTKWRSRITDLAHPGGGIPPAAYENDSTYIKKLADPESVCNGKRALQKW